MKKIYYGVFSVLFVVYLLQYTLAASAPAPWLNKLSWPAQKKPEAAFSFPKAGEKPQAKHNFQAGRYYLQAVQAYVTGFFEDTPILFTVSPAPASCNDQADGSLAISGISGGEEPFLTSVDGGKTYSAATVYQQMAAGIYQVRIKDAAGRISPVQQSVIGLQKEISFQVSFTNAGCGPDDDGEISFQSAGGGEGPYFYSIDGGRHYSPAGAFTSLPAGQYLLQVKDAAGCSSQAEALTLTRPQTQVTVNSTNATGYGSSTGAISVQASMSEAAGGEMLSLAWGQPESFSAYTKAFAPLSNLSALRFNRSTAQVATPGKLLSHEIEVFNAASSLWEQVYAYEDNSSLWQEVYDPQDYHSLSLASLDVSFAPKSAVNALRLRTGADQDNLFRYFLGTVLTLSGSNPAAETYAYSIDGGVTYQSSGQFSGLRAGTYTVQARNSKGCVSPARQVVISQPEALVLEVAQQNPTCTEPESGSISLQASGGTIIPPTGSPFTYELLWPQANSFSSTVVPFASPVTELSRISFRDPDGSPAQIQSVDGQPVTYKLDVYNPGTAVWENVYTAQATAGDPFSGNSIAFLPLTRASQVRFSASDLVNPVFNGFDNLVLSLEGVKYEGGTAYQYSADGGQTYQPGNTFTGLKAGVYVVAVKDARGYVKTDTVKLAMPAPCTNLSFALQIDGTACEGGATAGSIRISGVSGARRPVLFSIDKGRTFQADSVFNNLSGGRYDVLVKDALERVSPAQQVLIKSRQDISFLVTFENPGCGASADGQIRVSQPAGGTAPYTYSIDGGLTFSAIPEFTGLAAGVFQVQVKDAAGCPSNNQVVSLQQNQIVLTAGQTAVSCANGSNGSIQLAAAMRFPLQGQIRHLAWAAPDSFQTSARSFDPLEHATSLRFNQSDARLGAPGEEFRFDIEVYNAASSVWENVYSYSDMGVMSLSGLEVDFPDIPSLGGIRFSTATPSLFRDFAGTVIAFSGSGTEAETFAFSIDGGGSFQSAGDFPGLPAGSYTVQARNSKDCLSEAQQVSISQPAPLQVNIEKQQPTCLEPGSGSITLQASGGTVVEPRKNPYAQRLVWPGPGHFNQIVVPFAATLQNLEKISFEQDYLGGYAQVESATGQPVTYTIDLYNPAKGVWENVYKTQTATADYFPGNQISFAPMQASQIRFAASNTTEEVFGQFDRLSLKLEGVENQGGIPYLYSIDGGQTYQSTNVFAGLPAAVYPIAVKDAQGCITTDTVRLEVQRPQVSLDTMAAVCLDQAPFVLAGGSPAGGTFKGKGVSDNMFDPQLAGTGTHLLTYVYRNAGGCTDSATTQLVVQALPQVQVSPTGSQQLCAGDSLVLKATLSPDYTYQWWKDGLVLPDSTRANLVVTGAGEYQVVVTSAANGCPASSGKIQVQQERLPVPVITASGSTFLCLGGALTLSTPVVPGYQYQWYRNGEPVLGGESAQLITSAPGSYALQLTSGAGCSALSEPRVLTMISQHDFSKGAFCTGFESQESMTGWRFLDANADSLTWTLADGAGRQAGKALRFAAPAQQPADDWVFSRCLELEGGKEYTLDFYYALSQPLQGAYLKVALVKAQVNSEVAAEWDQGLLAGSADSTGFVLGQQNLQVLRSGVYYLAFQVYGPAGGSDLVLDDICLAETQVVVYNDVKNTCLQTDTVLSTGSGTWQELKLEGKLVGAFNDYGTALGEVFAEFYLHQGPIRSDAGQTEYLDRNWIFRSQQAFPGKPVGLRLYGMNQEVSRYQAANDGDLSDIGGILDLGITKFKGSTEDCQLGNNTGEVPAEFHRGVRYTVFPDYFIAETTIRNHFSEFYMTGGPEQVVFEQVKNNCVVSDTVVSRGLNTWQEIMYNGQIIGAIKDNGRILGKVYVELYLNQEEVRADGLGIKYFDRNWHVVTQYPFTGSTVSLRLYGTMAEFEQYRLATAGTAAQVETVEEIGFTKYSGPQEDCQLENNDFSNAGQVLFMRASLYQQEDDYFAAQLDVRDHFSELYANGGQVALPVELVRFSAVAGQNGVALNWRTATEKNNAAFEIEASDQGTQDFRRIGKVKGMGNSLAPTDYRFLDVRAPESPLRYYRLKQVDLDGDVSYSKIVAVPFDFDQTAVAVQPSVFEESFHLVVNTRENSEARMDMYATNGSLVLAKNFQVQAGTNKVEIRPAQALPQGLYLLHIQVGKNNFQKKVIRIRG